MVFLVTLLLLVGAAVADLATTALAINRYGIGGEANPVAVALYSWGGMMALVGAKGLIVIGVFHISRKAAKVGTWLWTFAAALNLLVLV